MEDADLLHFRPARISDAAAIAELHADSWRRHYRGAYADAYLDGDIETDRMAVWTDRLNTATDRDQTQLAEEQGAVVGFVHTILRKDPAWGALLDNLHVTYLRKRSGIGAQLLKLSAEFVVDQAPGSGLYCGCWSKISQLRRSTRRSVAPAWNAVWCRIPVAYRAGSTVHRHACATPGPNPAS